MVKTLQIRNVPESLHRKIKVRAAMAGKSLSDYLLEEIRRSADRPTLEELARRLSELEAVDPGETAAQAVRAERNAR